MADEIKKVKIKDLPQTTSINDDDIFVESDSLETYKVTASDIAKYVSTNENLTGKYIAKTAIGATNGVAPLNSNKKINGTYITYGTTSNTAYEGSNGKTLETNLDNHILDENNPHKVTKSQVGLGNVENKSSATIRGEITKSNVTTALGYTPLNQTLKGANSGLAELDSNGKVPSSQLPSYVDDVVEGYLSSGKFYKESAHITEISGETGKIYIDLSTEKTYRWSGSAFVVISETLALGETSSTAYRGDRGKVAYDHSQSTHARTDATKVEKSSTNGNIKINGTETTVYTHPSGTNPHGTTKSDVGLGNVGNFKAVSTVANQGLSDTEKSNARANIGAGTSSFSGSYNDLTNKPTIPTVGNGTITIKQAGTSKGTFTMNQSGNTTIELTDNNTTYSSKSAASGGTDVSLVTTGEKYTWNNKSDLKIGTTSTTAAAGNHTHSAYANQNAFSNVVVGSTTIAADSTTDTLTLVAGTNITLTPDATNDKITISSSGGTSYTLPVATSSALGGVKSGTDITVDSSGNVSVNDDSHNHVISNVDGLQSALDGKLSKTTYEYNKELALGSSGKVCIGVFPCYDSNISVEIKSTTSTTYNGTLVIATQNINTSLGGVYSATVYGDENNTLTSAIKIQYLSGSNAFSVYINLPSWSKNILHIQCVSLAGTPSSIATIVDSIPTTANIVPKNAFTHTHSYAGSSSAGGSATSAVKLDSSAGSATQPVYFSGGKPVATTYTLGTSVPSGAVFTDTKNTAGSTDTSSKIFLVGATSQATNPQTYSHDTAYVGTDGCLYSNSTRVVSEVISSTEPTNQKSGDYWLQDYE